MKAIGIDIGTTSICGVLIDCVSGEILQSVTKNSEAFITTENHWEKIQDTEKIISIATEITDGLKGSDVAVIGVTGQMHGIVYYDKNGKAVSPLYTWQDARGNLDYKDGKTYSQYLGIPAGYGGATDFYNKENGIRPQDAEGYCTIHDYFAMVLTKRTTPVIHVSDAASFGIDMSDATEGFDIIGEYDNIPVAVAIGDNQASVFGALKSDNDILLNIGTGSQVSVVTDKAFSGENIEIRPYVAGKYLAVGAALCGGRAYSMLEKFYSDIVFAATGKRMDMYEVMAKMEGVDNLPVADTRFSGTRINTAITGGITNITTENFTPGAVKNAFLNGIITELYNMFARMGKTGIELIGSGNGIRRNKELQLAAEKIFGRKMKIPAHKEEAAFGAALFGMTATGKFGTAEQVKNIIKYEG